MNLRNKAAEICQCLSEFGFTGVRLEDTNRLEDYDGDVKAHAAWHYNYAAFIAFPRTALSGKGEEYLVAFVKSLVGPDVEVKRYPACGEFEIYRRPPA